MIKNRQYVKFCLYGFLKNLRFFDAFFILFLLQRGLDYTHIGILYALREIFTNVFEIPSGIIADSYGRKSALLASFVAYIVSFMLFYQAQNFIWFATAFILFGLGDAFRSGTHKGMIMDYLSLNGWQDQKINYYGHTRSWSQKGSALSSLIAGLIVFTSGRFDTIFLYAIIPYIINLALIWSYPAALNRSIAAHTKGTLSLTSKSLLNILRQPKVLSIINTTALHSAYLKAVKDYIQPLMVSVALIIPLMPTVNSDKKNAAFIAVIYFFIYLATSLASRYSARIYHHNKLNVSYRSLLLGFVFGLLCGVFYYYQLWLLALLAFIGIYLIENIRKPILTGIISDHVPNDILTSVISAQSLLRTLITALLAMGFGILADHYGIGVAFMLVSALLLFSTLLLNKVK